MNHGLTSENPLIKHSGKHKREKKNRTLVIGFKERSRSQGKHQAEAMYMWKSTSLWRTLAVL